MSGIDYGMGQTNIDKETGIRFGVIPAHLVPWWDEKAEPEYGEPTCPKCGNPAESIDEAPEDWGDLLDWEDNGSGYCCMDCNYTFESEEAFGEEPIGWTYEGEGILAYQSGNSSDIFVTKSPFYTRAAFCSPCAPGACYLPSPEADGEKAYCLPHGWFLGLEAPYPVYRIPNGGTVHSFRLPHQRETDRRSR